MLKAVGDGGLLCCTVIWQGLVAVNILKEENQPLKGWCFSYLYYTISIYCLISQSTVALWRWHTSYWPGWRWALGYASCQTKMTTQFITHTLSPEKPYLPSYNLGYLHGDAKCTNILCVVRKTHFVFNISMETFIPENIGKNMLVLWNAFHVLI